MQAAGRGGLKGVRNFTRKLPKSQIIRLYLYTHTYIYEIRANRVLVVLDIYLQSRIKNQKKLSIFF